jgi:hypothetical protein
MPSHHLHHVITVTPHYHLHHVTTVTPRHHLHTTSSSSLLCYHHLHHLRHVIIFTIWPP